MAKWKHKLLNGCDYYCRYSLNLPIKSKLPTLLMTVWMSMRKALDICSPLLTLLVFRWSFRLSRTQFLPLLLLLRWVSVYLMPMKYCDYYMILLLYHLVCKLMTLDPYVFYVEQKFDISLIINYILCDFYCSNSWLVLPFGFSISSNLRKIDESANVFERAFLLLLLL